MHKQAMAKFAAMAKQLSAEQMRLSSDEKHLQRDENLVMEERKDLEMSISEQTAALEKHRDSARANLMTVEEEIEVLRRQLEAKEATAKNLRSEVERYDTDIHRIRDKFSRQLTRVERKEASVKENRYEWQKEKIANDTAKLAHDKEVEAHHKALVAHDALMEKLRKEITLADTFQAIVAKEVVFEKTTDKDLESDGDFAQLQADVVKSEAAVSEGRQILKAAEAVLNDLKNERDALIQQIPMLEETKTAAAARRDFKAAGKASKEIKEATARLKECQEELSGEARYRKDAALEDLVKLEADLRAKQAVLNEREKEAGKHAMEKVADKIRRLAETKMTVCGGAMDAGGIQAVGAYVLNGQVEALMREGSAYGEKFGGWDAIAEELAADGIFDITGATSSGSSAEGDVSQGGRPADEVDPEVIAKFRDATRRLREVEDAIDAAVARDDFEAAEKLNEELEEIKVEWEAIDLTAAEIKIFEGGDESGAGSVNSETDENAADENQPADISEVSSEDEESEHEDYDDDSSAGDSPDQDKFPEDTNGGDSGYVSEEGTELIDDSEHDVGGDNVIEKNVKPFENSEQDESSEKDEEPIEKVEQDVPDLADAADAEKDEEPVENGAAATNDTTKAAEVSSEEQAHVDEPIAENGH